MEHLVTFSMLNFVHMLQVGGGMDRTHRLESTFPRLAEPLSYVPKEDVLFSVKAFVVT